MGGSGRVDEDGSTLVILSCFWGRTRMQKMTVPHHKRCQNATCNGIQCREAHSHALPPPKDITMSHCCDTPSIPNVGKSERKPPPLEGRNIQHNTTLATIFVTVGKHIWYLVLQVTQATVVSPVDNMVHTSCFVC